MTQKAWGCLLREGQKKTEKMKPESIIREFIINNMTIWLLFLEELSEEEVWEMYLCCSGERREKIDRIKPERKRRQSIGAGYLLYLLKKKFDIEEEPFLLPGGKPVFRDKAEVHFSISHAGGAAVLAFGDRPSGVDIEYVKRADMKVAKRFFRQEEYEYILGQEEAGRADAFCRIWTGKEAVVKASGKGLSMPLDSFSVLGDTTECSGYVYELCRQKITEGGQSLWICAAQVIV